MNVQKTLLNWRNTRPAVMAVLLLTLFSCSGNTKTAEPAKSPDPTVKSIQGVEQFKTIVDNAGDRLLVFDLYADWCMPCKILSPMLEKIAEAKKGQADFYRINIDKNRDLASAFGVQGIPFVVFVKSKAAVHAFTGVQSQSTYEQAIDQFSSGPTP